MLRTGKTHYLRTRAGSVVCRLIEKESKEQNDSPNETLERSGWDLFEIST